MIPKNSEEAIRMGLRDIEDKFGISFLKIADGEAESEAPLLSKHRNFYNMPYGAVLFNLADNTAGMAYLRGAAPEVKSARCRAKVIKRGRKLCFIEARVEDDQGNLLSTYNFVYSDI